MTGTESLAGHRRFYCTEQLRVFSRQQQCELEAALHDSDGVTDIIPVTDPTDLQLDHLFCTINGGYRYSATGFQQLCSFLAPYAGSLIRDVAGGVRVGSGRDKLADVDFARNILNGLIRLRFDTLSSHLMLCDARRKVIDGLVGRKHKIYDNSAFYEQVRDIAATIDRPVVFHSAAVLGRRLLLWYRSSVPFTAQEVHAGDIWKFYGGYYFCNGEVRGTSARGTVAVFCRRGVCLGPYRKHGGSIKHIGKGFERRLSRLLGKILTRTAPEDQIKTGLSRLISTPLGFFSGDAEAVHARKQTLAVALSAFGAPLGLCTKAVENALYLGCESPKRVVKPFSAELDKATPELFASRTFFDLMAAAVRLGGSLRLTHKELIEQTAWRMLTGDLQFEI